MKKIFENKFKKDVVYTMLGQFIILITAFLLNKILSIKLSSAEFGVYNLSRRACSLMGYCMLAGLGIAIPKYISEYRAQKDKKRESALILTSLTIMLTISIVIFLLVFGLKNFAAIIIFDNKTYSDFILPMIIYSFSLSITTFSFSYYRGIDDFKKYNILQIVIQLITLLIGLTFNKNVKMLIYAWGIVLTIYGVVFIIKLIKYYKINFKIMFRANYFINELKEISTYCFPRIPGEFVLFGYTLVPLIIINYKAGMEMTAFFSAAISINTIISPVFEFVGVILLPLVSKSVVNKEFKSVDGKINLLMKLYIVIAILAIICVEIFTPFFIRIMFSNDYMVIEPIVRILIIAVLPNAIYLLLRNPLDAISKKPFNTINLFVSFIVMIIALTISDGIIGYSFSFVLGYSTLAILTFSTWKMCKNKIN